MADYFVASGGSNTAPYETWAKAATSLATALAAASTAGDQVIIQYNAVPSGDAELAADTTYTLAANIQIISASNDGGSAFTPTAMGTANLSHRHRCRARGNRLRRRCQRGIGHGRRFLKMLHPLLTASLRIGWLGSRPAPKNNSHA